MMIVKFELLRVQQLRQESNLNNSEFVFSLLKMFKH